MQTIATTARQPSAGTVKGGQSPIIAQLKAGASLKVSHTNGRAYLVVKSREHYADTEEVRRLLATGQLRPNGIDSNGNGVFALNAGRAGR